METIVELRTRGRGSSQQAWLEVSFAGLHPPVQLFDDLSMVGWTTPPIPPPPASAIDWTTPDPSTGQSFTLKDYQTDAVSKILTTLGYAREDWHGRDRRTAFALSSTTGSGDLCGTTGVGCGWLNRK